MSFTYGKNLKIQVFGQSHAAAIGVVMDGLPAGEAVDPAAVAAFMARRAPGKNALSTARREADTPEILCGLVDGHTVGAPLTALIRNTDTRSGDYAALAQGGATGSGATAQPTPTAAGADSAHANTGATPFAGADSLRAAAGTIPTASAQTPVAESAVTAAPPSVAAPTLRIPRPGHSDYPAFVRYGGANDIRGGGAFSGRMTAPLCFAGGVAQQLLARRGIRVYAHIASIGGVRDALPDPCRPDEAALAAVKEKAFPVLDDAAGEQMQQIIAAARAAGDSVGGSIRCIVTGLPAGLGAHMFDGVENRVAAAAFGIPGVRGIEFGSGFDGCEGYGSRQNDPYTMENGAVRTVKNDAGGVLGGSTTGMPLVYRLALKPTPSIGQPQQSVDLAAGMPAELAVRGRHDPCIVHRAVPVAEAVAAIAVLDCLLDPPAVWPQKI